MLQKRLGPFLRAILKRSVATSSLRKAAWYAGVSHVSLGEVLRGRSCSVAVHNLLAAARAAGATPAELRRVQALNALDRGALPIPDGATEQQVTKALAALAVRA